MFPLLFTNTALLIALAALAIPILIHLLLRRKKQRLRFSTIRFFTAQDEQSARRRKLRNLLLLATRLLLLALLVLAFARPYLPTADPAGEDPGRRQLVIILDRSASMQTGDRWARALVAAGEALAELEGNDRAALVEASVRAGIVIAPAPPTRVRSLLDEVQPGFGSSNLGEALREATRLLPEDSSVRTTFLIVSDLQERACDTLAAVPVPQGIETRVALVGEPNVSNLAVSGLELELGGVARIQVRNYSDAEANGVPLELNFNGESVGAQFVDVPARETVEVSMPVTRLDAGWHTLSAHLRSGDRFALDDVRHQVVRVPAPVPVLCVEASSAGSVYEAETYYLTSALDPSNGTTNAAQWSSFAPERIAPVELGRRLGRSPLPGVVFLPALQIFPSDLSSALLRFIEQGGGLGMMVGESLSPNRYMAELGALLPAIPGPAQGEVDRPEDHWRMAGIDRQTPLFAAFRRPDSGDLSLPVFKRRLALEPGPGAEVPARFIDGVPLVVTREIGQGRVALVNTTPDTTWTDWPKRRTFVPWIHSLAHWLHGRGDHMAGHESRAMVAGSEVELELGTDAAGMALRIDGPGISGGAMQVDEYGRGRVQFEQPGVYRVRLGTGEELQRLAVNSPAGESDPSALTPGEFQQRLSRVAPTAAAGWVTGLLEPISDERHFWRLLLMAVTVLLMFELFLANRSFA
jgi:hypothetical protein